MKKLLFIALVSMLISSCNVDDAIGQDFHFEILPIEEILMPESFTAGEFYQIDYSYYRPSTCYSFNELYYLVYTIGINVFPIGYSLLSLG